MDCCFLFVAEQCSAVWTDHCLLLCSSADDIWIIFHSLATLDNAYKNIQKWLLAGHVLVTLTSLLLGLSHAVPVSAPLQRVGVACCTLGDLCHRLSSGLKLPWWA